MLRKLVIETYEKCLLRENFYLPLYIIILYSVEQKQE